MSKCVCLQIPIKRSVLIEILAEGGDEGVNGVAGFLSDRGLVIANSKNNHLALTVYQYY